MTIGCLGGDGAPSPSGGRRTERTYEGSRSVNSFRPWGGDPAQAGRRDVPTNRPLLSGKWYQIADVSVHLGCALPDFVNILYHVVGMKGRDDLLVAPRPGANDGCRIPVSESKGNDQTEWLLRARTLAVRTAPVPGAAVPPRFRFSVSLKQLQEPGAQWERSVFLWRGCQRDIGGRFNVIVLRRRQIVKSSYSGFTSSAGGSNMPAATVWFVPGSTRMNEPVRRLAA